MPHCFFDARSEDSEVTDLQGREILHGDELRPAMIEAVRTFVGAERGREAWSLEVRLGASDPVAAMRFEDVATWRDAPAQDEPLPEAEPLEAA